MSKLEKLLSIRKRALGDFNHHVDEVKKFTTESNATAVAFRVIAMEKAVKDFVDANEELEKMSAYHEIEQLEILSVENRKIQDKYLEVKVFLAELAPTEDHTLNSSFFPTTSREYSERAENTNNFGYKPTGIKMPPIQLTPFEGDYDKWPEFRDMFLSLMKKYQGDDVEKLTHLKNYLKGPAFEAVKHISLENGNYEAAWDELKLTFENKNAIIEANLRKLTEIQPITTLATTVRSALSTTRSCLAVIQRFGVMTETWDPIIVFLLKEKLNSELRTKWEEDRKGSSEPATLKTLYNFLEVRLKVLLAMPPKKIFSKPFVKPVKTFTLAKPDTSMADESCHEGDNTQIDESSNDDTDAMFFVNRKTEKCNVCGDFHRVFLCPRLTANAEEALKLVQEKNLCTNCLYKHETADCTSKFLCKTCQKPHHSLLHEAFHSLSINKFDIRKNASAQTQPQRALLATALIPIQSSNGEVFLRALIDQGSTANLLSEKGAQLLHCMRKKIIEVPMYGVGEVQTGTSHYKTSIIIGSLYDKSFALSIETYITPRITAIRPITAEVMSTWTHLNGLQLADPTFIENKSIDILIGTRTFAEIIESGLIKGQPNEPIAQKTKLGWITSGSYELENTTELIQSLHIPESDEFIHTNTITNDTLSEQMKAFWEMEEVHTSKPWSQAEKECEKFFVDTVSRASDGKLIMRLPFNVDSKSNEFLGESMERAKHRFYQLERRFARNPSLKNDYSKCIEEYLTLKHAVEVPIDQWGHVIPHHAVLKESSTTTKLRVVFDASAKTSNGFSLNERMHIGPTILEELWAVLVRWRLGKIALIADIEKMYRQFWVHPHDAKFQQILWRSNPSEELKLLELQTVTFGTAAAPFLAIRGLHFIAENIESEK